MLLSETPTLISSHQQQPSNQSTLFKPKYPSGIILFIYVILWRCDTHHSYTLTWATSHLLKTDWFDFVLDQQNPKVFPLRLIQHWSFLSWYIQYRVPKTVMRYFVPYRSALSGVKSNFNSSHQQMCFNLIFKNVLTAVMCFRDIFYSTHLQDTWKLLIYRKLTIKSSPITGNSIFIYTFWYSLWSLRLYFYFVYR